MSYTLRIPKKNTIVDIELDKNTLTIPICSTASSSGVVIVELVYNVSLSIIYLPLIASAVSIS